MTGFEKQRLSYKPTTSGQRIADQDAMLADALAQYDATTLLNRLEAHIEGRPDWTPEQLEAFSNRIRRMAWAKERGAS